MDEEKPEQIEILVLLRKFKNWAERGDIQFLEKGSKEQKDVLKELSNLIDKFQNAKKEKAESGEGGISKHLNWYETHKTGRELWERLISCALNNIEPYSKGNSKIFGFLKSATNFEDLLYGLEKYYRDHTLHSLWVYLLGEYILRELIPDIHNNLNWYLYNDIEKEQKKWGYPEKLVKFAKEQKEKKLIEKVNKHRDAIWCVIALCHDLGYSLEKLVNLNEKVLDVLKFFDIPDLKQVGYSLDIEHQYLMAQFLEIMAMDVRIVPSENYREDEVALQERLLVKCYRDDATYWQLCRAMEKKQHGILSSYLIFKILSMFAEAYVRGPGEEWGLDDDEAIENIIRGDILFAIAQHTFDFAYLDEMSSLADVLILADDLEEFSRLGRDMLSREYRDTTAEANIKFKPEKPKQGDNIEIEIDYKVDKDLDLENIYMFFERKTRELCRMYSLGQDTNGEMSGIGKKTRSRKKTEKYNKISDIKMNVKSDNVELFFLLSSDSEKMFALLPATKIEAEEYTGGKHKVKCYEDDVLVVDVGDEDITLAKWLRIENKKG